MIVGQTILEQIKAIDPCALIDWGAEDFVWGKLDGKHEGVKFKTNMPRRRSWWVMILLNENDLYDIKVFRLSGFIFQYRREPLKDVPVENLVEAIDSILMD